MSPSHAPFGGATLIKGHGTRNDFILVVGPDATTAPVAIAPRVIAQLCDRTAGIGADGLIRVVPPGVEGNGPLWFMDYRNADGSLAQMCGNGARVFSRVLLDRGFITPDARGSFSIATRADPHAVVFVESVDEAGSLHWAPDVTPASAFPEGVNVEFVHVIAPGQLQMRVHERGAGETLSCGTGACAAVVAARLRQGPSAPSAWQVEVPGGLLTVTARPDGIDLRGPAVLTGEIPASELQFLAM